MPARQPQLGRVLAAGGVGDQRPVALAEGERGVPAGVEQVAPALVLELPGAERAEGPRHPQLVEDGVEVAVAVAPLQLAGAVVDQADKALYKAKVSGRNAVSVASVVEQLALT